MDKEAIKQFLQKEAALDSNTLLALSILAPATLGIGAGVVASKITSPSVADKKIIQDKLYNLELSEFKSELERRKKVAEIQTKAPVKQEREIRL
jgi:uncharacterized protein YqfA (UPF0365 family)